MASLVRNLASLTDAQARNLVVKSIRQVRRSYRAADTAGESEERELDRLIKRKTRMNANQLDTLMRRYDTYVALVERIASDMAVLAQVAQQFT